MVNFSNKISPILLSDESLHSHIARLVFKAKDIEAQFGFLGEDDAADKQIQANNMSGQYPYLIHRDMFIYSLPILIEYAEERYPQKRMMLEVPVSKAQDRLLMHDFERNIISVLTECETAPESKLSSLTKKLKQNVIAWSNELRDQPYFGVDQESILDLYFVAILWRIKVKGFIDIQDYPENLQRYAAKMFDKPYFLESLSEIDKDFL